MIDILAERAYQAQSPVSYTLIFHLGGQVRRPDRDSAATGWAAAYAININAALDRRHAHTPTSPRRVPWDALQPHATGGVYANFLGNEPDDLVRAAYGEHYGRLAQIKSQYDPDNVFHINQNITPAAPQDATDVSTRPA